MSTLRETPGYVTAGIDYLDELISRHIYQEKEELRYGEWRLPGNYFATTNSGMVHDLPGAPFTMRAFSWSDCIGEWETDEEYLGSEGYCENPGCDACEPNFHHKESGFKAYWYKHSQRGEECNQDITYMAWQEIVRDCENWIMKQSPKEPY